ncbi:uncharacterized protein LOC120431618 [Culex pipiens pallens]|uniref:uncharacterized protein LOC120431618 n=1 Tax=Culex pipiens pallens TaxID=42434 RepID=UPI001952E55F|nr:uncharacterized protein LOC120431618 [Culex pipiens pallens]
MRICTMLVCLIIMMFPDVLAAHVPEGCVKLKNHQMGLYLVKSNVKHDADRRHVTSRTKNPERWTIYKDEKYPNHYKIKHEELGEDLFESVQSYNGNYIFTWIPKKLINDGGASWHIYQSSPGYFILKNKKFSHCLKCLNVDNMMAADAGCDTWRHEWAIEKC